MQISHGLCAGFIVVALSVPVAGQTTAPPPVNTVSLSGPRVGVTFLSEGVVEKLAEYGVDLGPVISQFGWQFEKQFYSKDSGLTAVSEWVVLFGGLEQSVALPSVSWIVGFWTREGAEFGIGPNVTAAGTAQVIAAGVTFRAGALNVPVNVAFVPSKAGARVSMLGGFTLRSRR